MNKEAKFYSNIAESLCDIKNKEFLFHTNFNSPLPSIDTLTNIVENLKEIIFPVFMKNDEQMQSTFVHYVSHKLEFIQGLLQEQIKREFCFNCFIIDKDCASCETKSQMLSKSFIEKLPEIRYLLSTDVVAAFNGDPAAKNYSETILCYPSIVVLTYFRIAHELHKLGLELIPRMITEISHSKTGIDIHPAATIGDQFFIDHGTGVVIGETTIIGKNVRLYQGVTLGAKSFPLDEMGNPIKNIPRHPILEDNVIVFSNATILGRITIGENTMIGGNIWVTESVPPNSKIMQKKDLDNVIENGV